MSSHEPVHARHRHLCVHPAPLVSGIAGAHPDLLIAAHARSAGAVVVTNNVKDFSRVKGLEVENWMV